MKKIKTKLDLIKVSQKYHRPHKSQFKQWFTATIHFIANDPKLNSRLHNRNQVDLCIRLVEKEEMSHLTGRFRHNSNFATVLSFPCKDSIPLKLPMLGDIVMCGEAILNEARRHHIDFKKHWAFLFIHSVLHLLDFDHGAEMEKLEKDIMTCCNLQN